MENNDWKISTTAWFKVVSCYMAGRSKLDFLDSRLTRYSFMSMPQYNKPPKWKINICLDDWKITIESTEPEDITINIMVFKVSEFYSREYDITTPIINWIPFV